MRNLIRRTLGLVLALAIIAGFALVPFPTEVEAASSVSILTNAKTDIQNGVTLHCWNWSYNAIIENLPRIAAQGYTAIQVSPVQKAKQPTMGGPGTDWWVAYQPADFAIDNTGVNFLGTKAEFMNLCETAHEYGIYVIVDVVANHMAQLYGTTRSPEIIADILNDNSCWHNKNQSIGSDYSSRERITQYDLDSVLDLNTKSKKVQNYVLNYLKELIDAGADGFRFDAVKHIETPDDAASFASDFWPTVIYGAEDYAESKGLNLYCYGELLDHPDESGTLPDSAYTKYFSITDNSWGNTVRSNVVAGGNASAFSSGYHKNVSANQLVLWAESHDTNTNGSSSGVSVENINKTWALVAARADAMSLYLARMEGFTPPYGLGVAYDIGWHEASVGAVNKFHNAFVGQSEYIASSGSIAYVERGTSGVILVNVGGNGTSVSVPANKMANGTYKDQITGNTFTVSGGKIKGTIGSTGIAVVYNVSSCSHSSHYIAGICANCGASVSHSYSNGVCACGKTKPVTSGCTHSEHRYNGVCRGCGSSVGHTYSNGVCTGCGVEKPVDTFAYYLNGYINGANVSDANETYRFQDGKLTFYSSQDAYVSVRTLNGLYFQTTPDSQYNDTVLLHNASMGGGNNSQMRVPGGKTVTLYLQSNYNGTYTLSYAEGGIVDTPTLSGDTKTIYFDNSTKGWSKVNAYYWSASNTSMSTWPGTAMTKVEGDIYSVKVPVEASSIIFNDGTNQTDDLSVPSDSKNMYNGSAWSVYATDDGEDDGEDDGGEASGDKMTIYFQNNWLWSDVKAYYWGTTADPTWPGISMEKYGNDGTYDIYKLEVPLNITGLIINGVKDDGSGDRDKTPDITSGWYDGICYYMGWNDGNVANSKNISEILPTECSHSYTAKVTTAATCTKAGVKTYTCSKCGDSYTEEIAALGHSFDKGSCTICGAEDPDYVEVVAPTITLKTPTLLLEDTIKLNIYYTIDQDIALEKMGMITWSSKPSVVDISTAENIYPGATYNAGNGYYGVNTDGIPAQNLGDIIYFCVYAELADGTIAYGKQVQYSPATYAYNQINGGASAEMKALLVAVLNYGAAAQTYLEDTDALVNANLTDAAKALVEEYNADMVHSVAGVPAAKQGALASNGGFSAKKPSISLGGAFSINYYFTPSATVAGDMTLYYWNAADFAAADVLSIENATGSSVMTNEDGIYGGAVAGIAAKDVDSALYACGVYTDANGNTYSTGILPYSLGYYCGNQVMAGGETADLAAAIAVYGYYASIYFAQ